MTPRASNRAWMTSLYKPNLISISYFWTCSQLARKSIGMAMLKLFIEDIFYFTFWASNLFRNVVTTQENGSKYARAGFVLNSCRLYQKRGTLLRTSKCATIRCLYLAARSQAHLNRIQKRHSSIRLALVKNQKLTYFETDLTPLSA